MQYLMINETDDKNTENIADLNKIVTASLPKIKNFIPYPVSIFILYLFL